MSQWTHVNCSIRFDGIANLVPPPDLGKTVSYDDARPAWDECDAPRDTEGSLQTNLLTNDDPSAVPKWVATIRGDLRDYDNPRPIIEYLNRITSGHMIRSGIAEIYVEFAETVIVRYDRESNSWVEVGGK